MATIWQQIKNRFKQSVTSGDSKAGYVYNGNNFAGWEGKHFWGEGFDKLETNETIFSIVTRLANTLSSLPLYLIDDKGEQVRDDDLYKLVTVRPNPNMTAFEMWNKVEVDRNSRGNGFVFIEPDNLMQPYQLWPINPDYVTPMINSEDDTLWYRIQGISGTRSDDWRLVPSTSMIHVKHITGSSRIFGISPLNVLKGALDYDASVQKFQLSEMSKRDSFKIVYGNNVSEEKRQAVVENIKQFLAENGGVLFSEPGAELDTIDRKLSTQDTADNDSISRRRIANAFNVPITFLNETGDAGYKTTEQLMIQFVQMTLTPIARQYESEMYTKLLSNQQRRKNFYWKYNFNGLLRGDTASRKELYQTGIRNGFMTPNEVRELEGLKPSADKNSNKLLISGDLYPLDMDPTKRKGTTTAVSGAGQSGAVDRDHDGKVGDEEDSNEPNKKATDPAMRGGDD